MAAQTDTKNEKSEKKPRVTMDDATRKAIQAVVEKAGVTNVLLFVGQHVNRNALDVELGFGFQRKAIAMARKVPQLG